MASARGAQPLWERAGLVAGVLVPVVYYGIQIAAAPGYPDYDVTRQVASELGGPASRFAALFNAAILLVGGMLLIGGAAQFSALRRDGSGWPVATLAALGMAAFGVATLLAGAYPLPDPRHASGSPLLVAALAYPVVMLIAFRRRPGWRLVFVGCILAVVCAMLVISGAAGVDRGRWAGLIQRPVALAIIGPMELASIALLRRRMSR